jgi:ribonuclease HI
VTIIAAADGSALGNPGLAGWGWYVDDDYWGGRWLGPRDQQHGELTAVLDLLRQTAHLEDDLQLLLDLRFEDGRYLIDGERTKGFVPAG